jgi:HEAT repeat protein
VQDRFDRHDAIKALGAIGGKAAAHALAARLPNKDDRSYAKSALIKMGPVAEESVLPLVGDSNDDVHDAACDVIGQVGTNKSLSKLRALRRESSTGRRLAVSGAIHELEQRLVKKR